LGPFLQVENLKVGSIKKTIKMCGKRRVGERRISLGSRR